MSVNLSHIWLMVQLAIFFMKSGLTKFMSKKPYPAVSIPTTFLSIMFSAAFISGPNMSIFCAFRISFFFAYSNHYFLPGMSLPVESNPFQAPNAYSEPAMLETVVVQFMVIPLHVLVV